MSELENNSVVAEQLAEAPAVDPAILDEMTKAGILYGRKKSKTHPKMRPFIFATRNNIEIIDLPKTLEAVEKAGEFLKETAKNGGLLLVVGTQPAAQELVEEFAKKLAAPYVTKRWLGGTLTNFKTINKRTEYYLKLKSDLESGKLEKYTKKERVVFGKEIGRLTQFFSGLEKLARLPNALIVVNANEHLTAVKEALRLKVPIIAIVSTDTNPELVTYPIPANDNAKMSIAWILEKLAGKIEEGLRERQPKTEEKK